MGTITTTDRLEELARHAPAYSCECCGYELEPVHLDDTGRRSPVYVHRHAGEDLVCADRRGDAPLVVLDRGTRIVREGQEVLGGYLEAETEAPLAALVTALLEPTRNAAPAEPAQVAELVTGIILGFPTWE